MFCTYSFCIVSFLIANFCGASGTSIACVEVQANLTGMHMGCIYWWPCSYRHLFFLDMLPRKGKSIIFLKISYTVYITKVRKVLTIISKIRNMQWDKHNIAVKEKENIQGCSYRLHKIMVMFVETVLFISNFV